MSTKNVLVQLRSHWAIYTDSRLNTTHNMTKTSPAKTLMAKSAKCAKEGLVYGQCVLNSYSTMTKDSCAQEFNQFKKCVLLQMNGKKW